MAIKKRKHPKRKINIGEECEKFDREKRVPERGDKRRGITGNGTSFTFLRGAPPRGPDNNSC